MRKTIKILILSLFILSCKTQYNTSFDGIEAERFSNKKANSQSLKSDFKIATGKISKEFVLNKSNLLLLNGMIAVTNGYFSLSIVNDNGDEWVITNEQDQTIEFNNEIVELPNKGNYKINISLTNASGYYDFKWKEASDNLKNSNQNYRRKLIHQAS